MARRWVLLVNEDPAALTALEKALQGTGLHVTTSRNASHGAVQARELKPALIISDAEFGAAPAVPFLLVGKSLDLERVREQAIEMTKPPVPRPAEVVPEVVAEVVVPAPPPPRKGRRWVLIVTKDPGLVGEFEEALADTGLHVTAADDGWQAAVQARDLKPVMIVSDIQTPETLSAMRVDPAAARTPFLYITGADEARSRALLPPGDASVRCLSRPFEPANLKALALQLIAAASRGIS